MNKANEYDQQATDFLKKHSITFKAKLSDTKSPLWDDVGNKHGHHFVITLSSRARKIKDAAFAGGQRYEGRNRSLSFDFWASLKDYEDGITDVSAYSVLACISGDVNTPDTLEEFCSELGYDADSRKIESLFKRCNRFAKRLRAFFSEEEINDLCEIH